MSGSAEREGQGGSRAGAGAARPRRQRGSVRRRGRVHCMSPGGYRQLQRLSHQAAE